MASLRLSNRLQTFSTKRAFLSVHNGTSYRGRLYNISYYENAEYYQTIIFGMVIYRTWGIAFRRDTPVISTLAREYVRVKDIFDH